MPEEEKKYLSDHFGHVCGTIANLMQTTVIKGIPKLKNNFLP